MCLLEVTHVKIKGRSKLEDGIDTESVAVVVLPILSVLWVLQYIDATQTSSISRDFCFRLFK